MRLPLSLLLLLCLLVLGGSPTGASLAEAHTVSKKTDCKAKRGHAKRTCTAKARKTTCKVKTVRKTRGGKVTRTRVCTKRTRRHVHVRASGSKQCMNNKSRACRPAPAPAPEPAPAPAPAPAPEPAPAPAPEPAPAPAPAPEPAPAPAPTPAPPAIDLQPIIAWRAVGAAPLSDLDAASRVRPAVETRLPNAVANAYRPTASEIQAFLTGQRDTYGRLPAEYNPALAKVTGNFAGTTDEILQWAAHKWGIPEDIARAVAVTESYWRQDGYGDRMTVSNPMLYPAQSRISGTSDVYESLGIMQVKWRPDGSVGTGTEPLRWKSTAFNADFWAATVRYYYDGACSWCGGTYSPGQEKTSVGAWYSPYPWGNAGQQEYATKVWNHAADRTWARLGF